MWLTGGIVFWLLWAAIWAWVICLTVWLYRATSHYNRLTRGITKLGLKDVLESLVRNQDSLKKRTKDVENAIIKLDRDGLRHVQRVGVVRFNPFSDTGGAQSFTLALLDGHDTGIVMTSLYARTGNRWYIKEIVEGKGKDIELSKEEQAAIKHAMAFEYK